LAEQTPKSAGHDQATTGAKSARKHKDKHASDNKPATLTGAASAPAPHANASDAKPAAAPAASQKPPVVAAPGTAPAPGQADGKTPGSGKLPEAGKPNDPKLGPRFASLRSDKVYLRVGPSADYPIQWVYIRKGLPVEILANFDIWRKIRDFDGTEGWVNQQLLSGHRSALVTGSVRDLRHDPKPEADIVARLEPGVVAQLAHCDPVWCELKVDGYRGWLKREEFWGLEPGEVVE
jgi:SH3-like domain-containing protein